MIGRCLTCNFLVMKPEYTVEEAMDVIENGGEWGCSYCNEAMREADIEEAYRVLEDAGYTENCSGGWDGPDD